MSFSLPQPIISKYALMAGLKGDKRAVRSTFPCSHDFTITKRVFHGLYLFEIFRLISHNQYLLKQLFYSEKD